MKEDRYLIMGDLKDYRFKELKYYVVANVLIILLVSGAFSLINSELAGLPKPKVAITVFEGLTIQLVSAGLLVSIVCIYAFILDAIISSELKYTICYLYFWKQPGYTIFSKIQEGKVTDERFSQADFLVKYKNILNGMEQIEDKNERMKFENQNWYRIYNRLRNEGSVIGANRDYLLCRDLCIMSFLLLIAYILLCILSSIQFNHNLGLFIAVEFIITDIAFWIKGKRLALNVIAIDMYTETKAC